MATAPIQAPAFDEMVTGGGVIRPHWQSVVGTMTGLPPLVFAERVERARRQFVENGVTYNVYGAPRTAARHWSVDLLPLPLPPTEWAAIEAGMIQRATLFDHILADLHGEQRLLAERLYPAALVFDNPRYCRPLAGHFPGLHVYAADLVRAGGGQWWVLADRVDAPSGAGYALENRNVLARVLPEAFRAAAVRRLRPFFETWQAALHALAPQGVERPRIVLLTPGPYNETYFEHVYLARELGITLVEGADLTVRDARVYLKTLAGLQQVDVILRRVDSEWCDPLELRPDSSLGVPGLVEAVRAGTVAIANPLGAGLVETPAIAAFLPTLARHFLAADLVTPSIATWWCGQGAARDTVLGDMARMVLLPSFPDRRAQPIYAADLSTPQREKLAWRVRAQPHRWCAQEQVSGSAIPVWSPAGLHPQPLVLRVYAVNAGGRWQVMPGGLTRVSPQLDRPLVSMQQGGVAKDTWVLATEGEDVAVPAPRAGTLTVRRSPDDLPSRAAENLFWLGRYSERLDDQVRLLRSPLMRLATGGLGPRERVEVGFACRLAATFGLIDPKAAAAPPETGALAQTLVGACSRNPALMELFQNTQRLANQTRDRLSADLWQLANVLLGEHQNHLRSAGPALDRLLRALDRLVELLAGFAGMAAENITRHAGWRFLDFGRRLERALFAVSVARACVAAGVDTASARVGLELVDSTITYRSRYLAAPQPAPVLDLILTDETNPRSLAFQRARLAEHLRALPGADIALPAGSVDALLPLVERADLAALEVALADQAAQLLRLSEELSAAYFSHVAPVQAFGFDVAAE
jgi:uncharacterized circularly permuted ATP-grasp superfamily protein/uncharacterized alpha-E superfamily protein